MAGIFNASIFNNDIFNIGGVAPAPTWKLATAIDTGSGRTFQVLVNETLKMMYVLSTGRFLLAYRRL
jgi:hypothetical protein